jgi:protein LTV1
MHYIHWKGMKKSLEKKIHEMATTGKPEDFDGYFPDDGYDYTQHLREINPIRFIEAKSKHPKKTSKPSNQDLSDVLRALDGGADVDEVDESFAFKLGPVDDRTRIGMLWGEDQVDEYMSMPTDRLMAIKERLESRERQSAMMEEGTDDAEFEEFFAREFNDSQIGGLESGQFEIVDGSEYSCDDEDLSDLEAEQEVPPKLEDLEEIRAEGLSETKRFIANNKSLQQSVVDAEDIDDKDIVLVPLSNVPEWDCQSVLSLRSNTYNHPGKIFRPPKKVTTVVAPVIAEESSETESETPVKEVSTFRPKNETPEERKARKTAIKEFQRDQRASRKKDEKERKTQINKVKLEVAINKRTNFGDVQDGTSKFTI